MISAAVSSSLRVLRMRPARRVGRVAAARPCTSGITATPVSKPERPRASFGNRSSGTARAWPAGCRAHAKSGALPVGQQLRMGARPRRARPPSTHGVQRQVDGDDADRQADRLAEALAGRPRPARRASSSVSSTGWWSRLPRHERVLDDVGGGVGRGQRDGDDEVGEGEAEQHQHERLAPPARQQLLEHQDAALAVRAAGRHLRVDGQGHEQRDQDQDQGGHRRQRRRRPGTRCRAGSRGSRSSRRRSGTSPSTRVPGGGS